MDSSKRFNTLKKSHPLELAEYYARVIDNEPAFKWWTPYTMRKSDVILSAVNSRLRQTTHKYGIGIPTSIVHGELIDARNKNHFWRDALNLVMQTYSTPGP